MTRTGVHAGILAWPSAEVQHVSSHASTADASRRRSDTCEPANHTAEWGLDAKKASKRVEIALGRILNSHRLMNQFDDWATLKG